MLRIAIALSLLTQSFAHSASSNQVFLQSDDQADKVGLHHGADLPKLYPVPAASRCIINIMIQYMLVYTALAVCRSYHEFTATAKGTVEEALRGAAQTLTYGPMLCVLFIACRMRVEFLSDGTDHPQIWVQRCMYGVTYAVLASSVLVLLIPLLTGKPLPLKEGQLEVIEADDEKSPALFFALTVVRYLILLCLYVGLAGIIVGINIYLPPGANDLSKLPPPAPAVACTMILAVAFFSTQLVIAFCRSYEEFKGVAFPRMVAIMQEAATTIEFGPMLAILFLCARMRALQHDSQPQAWAQDCMYLATTAVIITTILAVAIPLTCGGTVKTCERTNEKTFVPPENASKTLIYTLNGLRYFCMIGFYGGAVGVIYSIYTFEAPGGPEATVPVSPTAHCVACLTCQFFFVYFMMTVMNTMASVTGEDPHTWKLFSAMEAAKATLGFAPMLAILFVTTRMYALLITNKKGAPQAWVQDGMYMSTWALLISLLCCLGTGLAMDEVKTDEDGNVVNKFSSAWLAVTMTAVRYLSMLLLYGGIVLVIVGLFQMTPQTANGRGSLPIFSDVVNATPFGHRPPSPVGAAAEGIDVPSADSTGAQGR